LLLPSALGLLLTLAVGIMISRAAPAAPLRTLNSGHHFLPPYASPRDRFGFGSGALTGYDVALLHAGWYSNWSSRLNPSHPDGLTYVQLIRFHAGADPHDPAQVTVNPSREVIAEIARAHPGSLWFMSNEPDSIYQGDPIYPDVYAHVYHDFYTYIKGLDATALIANGGIVQPTPCRLEYLDIVWDTYQQTYGEPMPVDVWNIHAFILREVYGSWGASTPPGIDPSCAMDYSVDDGDNINILRDNMKAMREWMKEKGYQDRPLIVSEYGALWPEWFAPQFTPQRVSHFMTQTFDLFLYETDLDIGYPADDYRLVQAWAWYSLSDQYYNGYLFYNSSQQISPMGQAYADYTAALTDTQAIYVDLSTQLWVNLDPLEYLTPTVPYDALTVTLPVTGAVADLSKLPATGVVITSPLLGFQATQDVPGRYEEDVAPLSLPTLVLTRPGVYDVSLIADQNQALADSRRWNNAFTSTVDARPDLLVSAMAWSIQPQGILSGVLNVTLTVSNGGLWPSPLISGTLAMSDTEGTLFLPAQRFPIPALGSGAQVTIVEELALSTLSDDFYRLALDVDSDEIVDEWDESNNLIEMVTPIVVTTMLQSDVGAVLTSTGGQLAVLFSAETVTTPTEIRFTPRMTSELPPGSLISVTAFELAAYRDGQPVSLTPSLPITVTWQYTDTDVIGLDEDALGLHRLMESDYWQRVACQTRQHLPEVNRLSTCIQRLGEYAFGQSYVLYGPILLASGEGSGPQTRLSMPHVLPGSTLRLPPWPILPEHRVEVR
ncbi:MAG: hypothetical protein SWK90_15790, partial [Chloroflexota bacterium]|nr:hypothetical protein [Chloroflexota bacterium]